LFAGKDCLESTRAVCAGVEGRKSHDLGHGEKFTRKIGGEGVGKKKQGVG